MIMKKLLLTILSFITGWAFLHLIFRPRGVKSFVIGHRGAAGLAPENTLAAIREGIRQGASFIEIDVQLSVEGKPVIFHDTLVDRTTNGFGAVCSLTWDALRKLDAGSYFAPDFAGEPIPLLAEAMELLKTEPEVTLVIEAKDPELYPLMGQQLASLIREFGAEAQVVVISFDHQWLGEFRQLAPNVRIGTLWGTRFPKNVATTDVVDIAWPMVLIDPTLVRRMNRQGNQLWVYTVNSVWLMRLLSWLGVEGITTDRPDLGCQAK
jgi:glycerophosphoryl diester phosphodiesterase